MTLEYYILAGGIGLGIFLWFTLKDLPFWDYFNDSGGKGKRISPDME